MRDEPTSCKVSWHRRAIKRAMDIGVSACGLIVLFPALIAVGLVVRLDSAGPAIYRCRRVGRDGRQFTMLKFRSMRIEQLGPDVQYHERITRVGRVLRRYKIDELPQLINVLRGDMSLVGPRPELPGSLLEGRVLPLRPGLTDYASIVYIDLDDRLYGADPEMAYTLEIVPRKTRLREMYVRRQSTRGDLRILLATAGALFRLTRGQKRGVSSWKP